MQSARPKEEVMSPHHRHRLLTRVEPPLRHRCRQPNVEKPQAAQLQSKQRSHSIGFGSIIFACCQNQLASDLHHLANDSGKPIE
ncbi:hypothetical protein ACLB2K_041920 [Fragaria x ananassa]